MTKIYTTKDNGEKVKRYVERLDPIGPAEREKLTQPRYRYFANIPGYPRGGVMLNETGGPPEAGRRSDLRKQLQQQMSFLTQDEVYHTTFTPIRIVA